MSRTPARPADGGVRDWADPSAPAAPRMVLSQAWRVEVHRAVRAAAQLPDQLEIADTFADVITIKDRYKDEMVHAVTEFIIARLADLVSELRAVQVGDGNLMDHACILVASEMMNGSRHSVDDGAAALLLGKAGGRLRTDYHHRPESGADRNYSKVLVTVMEAMGLDDTSIEGGLMESPNGPIDEILLG